MPICLPSNKNFQDIEKVVSWLQHVFQTFAKIIFVKNHVFIKGNNQQRMVTKSKKFC